ncbi:hypothetical protein PENSPDRAFT_616250 [Peniophora sp. CONT]|nr:hypothetical protein PENSPDRAFT_616250 [Peniophora sp. CONT]
MDDFTSNSTNSLIVNGSDSLPFFDSGFLDDLRESANSKWERYKTGDLSDVSHLSSAIEATQAAMGVEPKSCDDAELLFDLGCRLGVRFHVTGEVVDLVHAASVFRYTIALIPEAQRKSQAEQLHDLCGSLQMRLGRMGGLNGFDCAVVASRCAVELRSDGGLGEAEALRAYSNALEGRFHRYGKTEDVDCAISSRSRLAVLVPDDHFAGPSCLTDLGSSFHARFSQKAELDDLEQALYYHRRAVDTAPDGYSRMSCCLNNLGNSLQARFDRTGNVEDLQEALECQRRSVDLAPNNPLHLINYGTALSEHFKRTGNLEDLDRSITIYRRAVELLPSESDSRVPWSLSALGDSLRALFKCTGELDDIETAISYHVRAINLTPDDHPLKLARLWSLVLSLRERFEHTDKFEDLNQLITYLARGVELTADGHPDKPAHLNYLGSLLKERFSRVGKPDNLQQNLLNLSRALVLTPDDDPNKPRYFSSLACAFLTRYKRYHELSDLDHAVRANRYAVENMKAGHLTIPICLSHLGNSLLARFQKTEQFDDIEQAIQAYGHAVELTPDADIIGSLCLDNLGFSWLKRFGYTHNLDDLAQALAFQHQVNDLTPEGHPEKAQRLTCLGNMLFARHGAKPDRTHGDLNAAISACSRAIAITPLGDPALAQRLHDLGRVVHHLLRCITTQQNFAVTIQLYTDAIAHSRAAVASEGLDSAIHCVELHASYPQFSSTDSLLSAYSLLIEFCPEVVWLGYSVYERLQQSARLGVHITSAVAAAIAAGSLTQAAEWLETGRALVWSQVLSLRTPLHGLRDAHPELAESLQNVQQELRQTAHISSAHIFDDCNDLSLRSFKVDTELDRHRQLAAEQDSIVAEIRRRAGFERFLRPKRLEALITPSGLLSGPVVFINMDKSRCDALLLSPDGKFASVDLSDLSYERAVTLRRLWITHTIGDRTRARGSLSMGSRSRKLDPLKAILGHLWKRIVRPILEALNLAGPVHNSRIPHITWCPTGPLMQLPLHAAGLYDEPSGPRAYEFVVSSYTPSLSALLRSCAKPNRSHSNVLVVTQPDTPKRTPLPETIDEAYCMQNALNAAGLTIKWLNHDVATVHEVRSVMDQFSWVHLACHGSQHPQDPTKSAFELFDGPLTLSDLMGTVAENAELAFLSACQTAVGDEKMPEESAHLAAGMLAVGFKGVIGTMWSIQDADAPIVVEAFYKELLALRNSGAVGRGSTGAAYALHEATRVLREKVGESAFMRWVPFVHFGV